MQWHERDVECISKTAATWRQQTTQHGNTKLDESDFVKTDRMKKVGLISFGPPDGLLTFNESGFK